MRKLFLSACALACAGAAQADTFAIVHARILTAGPAGEIADGTIVVRDGKIASVVAGTVAIVAGGRVIDAGGATVTPGFFATSSEIGAVEVGSLGDDLTVDNPDVSAAFDVQYALDPRSTLIPEARRGGITSAIITPQAGGAGGGRHADDGEDDSRLLTAGKDSGSLAHGLFAGQAAVITLAAGDEILVRAKVAQVAPFGRAGARVAGGARGAEYVAFKAALADVRAYMANRVAYDRAGYRDLALSKADLEALIPVVQGRMPVIVVAHKASDIRAVLKLAREEKIKVILEGAEEGWLLAKEIAGAGVPVLTNPLTDRPDSYEILAASMENATRLQAAGVTVAIEASENSSHRARETRYGAGNAVAHGMPYAAALQAISLNPAKIFGVADRTGSLEAGKDADLVIWTGDPFEPLTQASAVYIKGVSQPMSSRQIELRDRYKDLNRPLPPGYSH